MFDGPGRGLTNGPAFNRKLRAPRATSRRLVAGSHTPQLSLGRRGADTASPKHFRRWPQQQQRLPGQKILCAAGFTAGRRTLPLRQTNCRTATARRCARDPLRAVDGERSRLDRRPKRRPQPSTCDPLSNGLPGRTPAGRPSRHRLLPAVRLASADMRPRTAVRGARFRWLALLVSLAAGGVLALLHGGQDSTYLHQYHPGSSPQRSTISNHRIVADRGTRS
jgi:hypothetical protein